MSENDKKGPDVSKVTLDADGKNELDDKALESVSGGAKISTYGSTMGGGSSSSSGSSTGTSTSTGGARFRPGKA